MYHSGQCFNIDECNSIDFTNVTFIRVTNFSIFRVLHPTEFK